MNLAARSDCCVPVSPRLRCFAFSRQSSHGYADPETCAGCHDAVARRYAGTGMAQSFGAVLSETGSRQLTNAAFLSRCLCREYFGHSSRWLRADGRHQSGFRRFDHQHHQGEYRLLVRLRAITQEAISAARTVGELTELPLTWYSENGGYWAMSPGYDSASHGGFSRKATYRCMFCHNAYPDMAPGADRMDNGTKFPTTCRAASIVSDATVPGWPTSMPRLPGRPAAELKSLIVNPASLPGERRDRSAFSATRTHEHESPGLSPRLRSRCVLLYSRPATDQYIRFFDHAPGTGHDDKFEFAGAPYRLRKSKCFIGVRGAHLYHLPRSARAGEIAIRRACECGVRQLPSRSHRHAHDAHEGKRHQVSGECVSCHMPERRPSDAIHVTVTDHYIRRDPAPGPDPTVELNSANTPPYRGEVVPYYPRLAPDDAAKDLYTALAQIRRSANADAGISRLEKAIAAVRPANADSTPILADAHRHAGNSPAAIPTTGANSRDPEYWPAWHGLGLAMAATGDLNGSLAPLRRAVSASGGDSSVVRSLASVLTNMGRSAGRHCRVARWCCRGARVR